MEVVVFTSTGLTWHSTRPDRVMIFSLQGGQDQSQDVRIHE